MKIEIMLTGLLTVNMHLHAISSLKQKRGIVKSLIGRLQSRFNASVSEVGAHDSKQLGIIGIAVIASDGSFLDEQLDKIVTFIHNDGRFFVGQIHRETFTSNHELPRL
ncbi:MAG: DUF503 domain-containing protein [Planctomycetota bacterium]